MVNKDVLQSYIQRIKAELTDNILPFWMRHVVDRERGGFYGSITNDLVVDRDAPRGALLSLRILWTYAAAYQRDPRQEYLDMATHAALDLGENFMDNQYGGMFWLIAADGRPLNMRKQIYGQAFGLYALAEFSAVTGDPALQDWLKALFRTIERHAYDPQDGGYLEAFDRDWRWLDDLRLSDVDMNTPKSMNTHLHVMEAYTNLRRVLPNDQVIVRHRELIEILMRRIVHSETHHTILFFDRDWQPRSDHISFGHDIEASWLLVEAAEVDGDESLIAEARRLAVQMAQAVYDEGRDADGGLFYEAAPQGVVDSNKEWWPQAEAAVGFLNAYQISGQAHFLTAALQSWDFIERHLVDRQHGEWFRAVTREGVRLTDPLKVSFWKCPYHNSRACMEMIKRLGQLMEGE